VGGGPSGGGDSTGNSMTNKDVAKAKANKQRKEMAQSGVQDPLDFTRLTENLQAQKLEREAGKSQINLPIPTLGSVAMNTISSFSAQNQAKELRRGGEMITDDKGNYQGVVGKNFLGGRVYSGNTDFDPIGGKPSGGDDNSLVTTQRQDITPEKTAEITPEIIPNDESITTRYARKRTRRVGQAGTIMEGYGALTRKGSTRSIT
tara:strand:- start:1031 stop:1642 length:612 start_codon:yes stop_codon:yes gene_type:complete